MELTAEISAIDPVQPEHVGALIEISLTCARSFGDEATVVVPTLYSVNLRRSGRTMLAYLPADAFWALQVQLSSRNLEILAVKYGKPLRGRGDILSLHFY